MKYLRPVFLIIVIVVISVGSSQILNSEENTLLPCDQICSALVCGGTPCYCTNPAEPISCRAWSLGACGQAHWCGGGE